MRCSVYSGGEACLKEGKVVLKATPSLLSLMPRTPTHHLFCHDCAVKAVRSQNLSWDFEVVPFPESTIWLVQES